MCYFSAGVIDQDYRGNVGVVMFNFGETDFQGLLEVLDNTLKPLYMYHVC